MSTKSKGCSEKTYMKIEAKNIGPFGNLKYKGEGKIKSAIYARNGSGKTFLSRCFALLSSEKDKEETAHIMLKKGTDNARFSFSTDKGTASFYIKDGKITFSNKMDRLFYVFNSDYVEENLYKKNYQLDGRIDGVILGKENIELDKAARDKDALLAEADKKHAEITQKIDERKKLLRDNGVSYQFREYKQVTYNEIKNMTDVTTEEFDEKIQELHRITNLPDDIEEVPLISFKCDDAVFIDLIEILGSKYSANEFEKEFETFVKDNLAFIETGLSLSDGKVCPFCKTAYGKLALDTVHMYNDFVNDEQTKVIKSLQDYSVRIDSVENRIKDFQTSLIKTRNIIANVKEYIKLGNEPEYKKIDQDIAKLSLICEKYKKDIQGKINNLQEPITASREIHETIERLYDDVESVNDYIRNVNYKISNVNEAAKTIKRESCKELAKKLSIELKPLFIEEEVLQKAIIEKEEEIISLKEESLTSKRDMVAKSLDEYIENTFYGKYTFDTETFEISLGDNVIGEDAKFVLSDGEKSAFAFIHYLANIHTIVESEDDYEKIIFVMDDPISSMDYLYIYEMLSNIRFLNKKLNLDTYRLIILTHSLEFFSTLKKNKVIDNALYLRDGKIDVFNEKLITPYEFHLKDIRDYQLGKIKGDGAHTIPNSIRHVVETICHFEGMGTNSEGIRTFLSANEEFTHPGYVYSLIEDLSHGNVTRKECAYSEDQIKVSA